MIPVTAAILEKDGKILLARRKKGESLEFMWEFPGGKIEPGESPQQCLMRELMEEFNIITEVGRYICQSEYQYQHICISLQAYHTTYVSGQLTLKDHDMAEWVNPEDLLSYNLAPADIPIARIVADCYADLT